MRRTICLFAIFSFTACAPKAPVDDDESVFADDLKSDFLSQSKNYGRIATDGVPSKSLSYTSKPRYRSVGFGAVSGDQVTIWVTSTNGDPVAWLVDFAGKVIAKNDDASSDVTDSRIMTTLTPSNGNYTIYFRDYNYARANFKVSVLGGHGSGEAADAERTYDSSIGTLDNLRIKRASLPSTAQSQYDEYVTNFGHADAFQLWQNGKPLYVVASSGEEIYWIDIYTATGRLIIHGFSGDGGPEITFWGSNAPWDPSVPH